MATRTRRPSAAKSAQSARKGRSARKRTAKRSSIRRVKRVTREVVHQAAVVVSAGVETLKGFGENLVDRVR